MLSTEIQVSLIYSICLIMSCTICTLMIISKNEEELNLICTILALVVLLATSYIKWLQKILENLNNDSFYFPEACPSHFQTRGYFNEISG